MEAIIFCGIQATGKSTFYKKMFFNSYVHVSMDLLKTRNREQQLIDFCLKTQMPFVVDNTNLTIIERAKYISLAKERKYKIIAYYFQSKLEESLSRNKQRIGKECIPDIGILSAYKKLQLPSKDEGFDELYYVSIKNGEFQIKEWSNEI